MPSKSPSSALPLAVCVAIAVAGCSTASKDIAPLSVSPLQYQAYECDQLGAELARLGTRVTVLGGRLDQAASNDAALTTVGVILFWPALFFLGGTRPQEAEYAMLRGQYEAVQQAAIVKRCKLALPPAAVPEGVQEAGVPARPVRPVGATIEAAR